MIGRSQGRATDQKQKSPLQRLVRLIIFAMVISAVAQELSKPAADRTWHGQVWRYVPYDFRLPTWERVRDSLWAPDNPQLLTHRAFGVGWAVNLGRIYAQLKSIVQPEDS